MTRGLLKSTSVVGGMTMLSRILGLVRDVLLARLFGAAPFMDAFFVAFKIPNFLRRLFAEGAFSQAFVPVLGEYKSNHPPAETRELVDRVAGALGTVLAVVTIVGVVAAPVLVLVFAPGFADGDGRYTMAAEMLRWTFPYLFFISLTAFAGGILNTWGRFGVPAFTPVLLNLAIIGAAIWLAPGMDNPGLGLAIGVFIAGAAQLALQLPFLARLGLLPRPRYWKVAPSRSQSAIGDESPITDRLPQESTHDGVGRIFKLMLPAIFGSSVAQINLLLDTLIASFLVTGSISWLYYSDRLMEFPLGVFGIALATVILPRLSGQHASKSADEFAATLDWSLRWTLLVGLPAATGLFVLAGPAIATIFEGGVFTTDDTAMARMSLMAYAFGLLGFSFVKVLAPGYFARQDTRTPVRAGIIAMSVNMVLNIALVVPWVMLGHAGPHAGLAAATSVAAFVNAALLYRGLRGEGVLRPAAGWPVFILRVVIGCVAMGALVHWAAGPLESWRALDSLQRAGRLAVVIAAGVVAYPAVLWIIGLRRADLKVTSR